VFVCITDTLWLYFVGDRSSSIYAIDAKKAGLDKDNVFKYGGSTHIKTLQILDKRGAVTAVFKHKKDSGWFPGSLESELPVT
jgi:hypothetical protein